MLLALGSSSFLASNWAASTQQAGGDEERGDSFVGDLDAVAACMLEGISVLFPIVRSVGQSVKTLCALELPNPIVTAPNTL